MNCKYAQIRIITDTNAMESSCVCEHPKYEIELKELAGALSEHGKTLIPNKECQFVRELDCNMCPLRKEE